MIASLIYAEEITSNISRSLIRFKTVESTKERFPEVGWDNHLAFDGKTASNG